MSAQCPHRSNVSCSQCNLSGLCLPLGLGPAELEQVSERVMRGKPLQKSETVYRVGDEFTAIYAVRSGSVKLVRSSEKGELKITGFYLPGEIFGLDGLGSGRYLNSAQAMETSAICRLPFDQLEDICHDLPDMQRHLFQVMGKEINHDQELMSLLGKSKAEQRIAAFLLSLSARYHRLNLSASRFIMPMTRSDAGNFLGLTIETVSRIFTRLKKDRVMDYQGRDIRLLNVDYLRALADD